MDRALCTSLNECPRSAATHRRQQLSHQQKQHCPHLAGLSFSQLTDLFGDIPYSAALTGASSLNFTPTYDRQQNIYYALINELKQASAAMDPNQAVFPGNSDPLYKGSVSKWKQFANSLRLRLAMRMSIVDPVKAQQEIAALQNEIFISFEQRQCYFPLWRRNPESTF
ncbi:MAG: SusD/RagB family nutrient-binding outer membrane lipoprotein [Bacteroidetes bacterium]|nr:SusD/RagB family nutrient-binding outer membrane lipoprotein [Bacteroidota bacterium]